MKPVNLHHLRQHHTRLEAALKHRQIQEMIQKKSVSISTIAYLKSVLKGLTAEHPRGGKGLDIERLDVHAQEIVGIAGISGNGQKELVEVLAGQRPASGGEVLVPWVPTIVTALDLAARQVYLDPPEGLLELANPTAEERAAHLGFVQLLAERMDRAARAVSAVNAVSVRPAGARTASSASKRR